MLKVLIDIKSKRNFLIKVKKFIEECSNRSKENILNAYDDMFVVLGHYQLICRLLYDLQNTLHTQSHLCPQHMCLTYEWISKWHQITVQEFTQG